MTAEKPAKAPRRPAVPASLAPAGKALWQAVTKAYELRADELRLLEDACRTADLVDQLAAGLRGEPLTLPGVAGQPRVHPLLTEVRQQRLTLAGMLKQLRLPDEPGEGRTEAASGARSAKARNAANARWHRNRTGLGGA